MEHEVASVQILHHEEEMALEKVKEEKRVKQDSVTVSL